jgi:hypothetical protein
MYRHFFYLLLSFLTYFALAGPSYAVLATLFLHVRLMLLTSMITSYLGSLRQCRRSGSSRSLLTSPRLLLLS